LVSTFPVVNNLPISCCLFLKKSRNVWRTWLLVQNEEWRRLQNDRWVKKFFREIRFICTFTDNTEKLWNKSFSFFSVFLCGLFMFTFWMLQRQRHLLFIICATLVAAVKSTLSFFREFEKIDLVCIFKKTCAIVHIFES